MEALIRTPKTQLGILLTLIFATAVLQNPSIELLVLYIISIASSVIFDFLFLKIRKVPFFFPSAALVTGVIIALLISPLASWHEIVFASFTTMFFKNFLRLGRHIFNPAAAGLLASSILFNNPVSWWGVSFQQFSIYHFPSVIFFLILLAPFLISAIRMRRYRIQLAFFITYVLIQIPHARFLMLKSILDPTVLFFTAVILPEPMTSPNRPVRQVLFGILVAIFSFIVSSPILNSGLLILTSVDPLIFALLLGNLVFFKLR